MRKPSEIETVRAEYKRTGNISEAARTIGAAWLTARNILLRAGDIPPGHGKRGCPKGHRRPSLHRRVMLAAVEIHGSVKAAAVAMGVSQQAIRQAAKRERTGSF